MKLVSNRPSVDRSVVAVSGPSSPQLFVNFQTLLGQAIARHEAQSLEYRSRTGMVIIRGTKRPKQR